MKEFTVVMRGPSAVIFRERQNLLIQSFPTEFGPVNVTYASRWLKVNENELMPGHIWIEIRGQGSTLEEAIAPFANAGLMAIPIMALCSNAAIGDPEVEIAFDSTPDLTERDYFQSFVPFETGLLHAGRVINIEATIAFFDVLKKHSESERLLRAISQYHLTLNSWKLGHSIIALAHLWMAMEALTEVKLRSELATRGLKNDQALADDLGVEIKLLRPTIRKKLILNDDECYRKAKQASDGFEHGFEGLAKLRELSAEVRHRMANYIRFAIFELSGLEQGVMKTLISAPYDKPLGNWNIAKYLRGKLIGTGMQLARPGNAYPYIKWKSGIKKIAIDQVGNLEVQMTETFEPELAEGVSFQPSSHEVWKPD